MSFLANQGFDFRETFLNGINYEKMKKKEKLHERIESKPKAKWGFFLCEKSENSKTNVLKKVEEFMNTANKNKIEIDCETAFLARHLFK